MEENKEKKGTEYTGEYGNSVEGDYTEQNQTTYSYSYKDGNGESTHTGDYYEGQDAQTNEANTAEQSAGSTTNQSANHQNSGYQQNSNPNNNYQNPNFYQNSNSNNNYQNPNFYQNNNQNAGAKPPKQKGPKEPLSFGKKVLLTVAGAVLFGLVAGVCFNGVNFISQKVLGTDSANTTVGKTTVGTTTSGNVATGSAMGSTDVSAITEQSMPAVVAITSTTSGTAYYDLFGQYYQGQDATSSGTGFIVGQNDKELLIATNNHVIDGAKTISVQFIDGEIYEATEKGADSSNDLAVVAVKTADVKKATMNKIKIADLGDSADVKVGEMVIAIGNALGYGQSVTVGYVSAKDREITESSADGNSTNKIKALQTDAAINPGNSGGALINMKGQVIGINSAKIADSSVEGVGYAIPISVATPIIDELMNREALSDSQKGYLGISGSTVTEAATAYNVPYGVYVKEVAKGGAAEEAGIKANDVITAINKMEVTTMESLQEKVNSYKKGTKVEITIQRSNNGKYTEKKVTAKLQGSDSLNDLSDDSSSNKSNNDANDNSGNNGSNNSQGNDGSNNSQGNDGSGDGSSLWDQFFN